VTAAGQSVVLVTGCSSGIGRALARELSRRGQRCFASARRAESVLELEREGLEAVPLDVTSPDSIRAAVDAVVARAERIDVLVNNAGASLFGPLAELPLEDVRGVFETNVIGALGVCQAVFPHMASRGRGRIVNVGSMVGVVPTPWAGAYCGAKAALHAISEALRVEVAPFGLEVVVVQPGAVRSSVSEKSPCHSRTPHYAPLAAHIERRARASQERPMEAEAFARRVADAVTAPRPPRTLRAGGGVTALRALGRLPGRLRDRIFGRAFGLAGPLPRG